MPESSVSRDRVPGGLAYPVMRQAAVDRYARVMRDGQVQRDWTFGFTPPGRSETEDITAAVLEAAGPETEEERTKRVAFREVWLAADIEVELQIQMDQALGMISSPRFRDEEYDWDEDAEDSNEFVIVRKKDGRKFRVENTVSVTEITNE